MQTNKDNDIKNMVDSQLRANGIHDTRVLHALMEVDRPSYVLSHLQNVAFIDRPIQVRQRTQLSAERMLFPPLIFAKMLQGLGIKPTDIVLDIGSATGYGVAVLSKISESVIAIDNDEDLVNHATQLMINQNIGNAVIVHCSDMYLGYEQEAPYDVILVEGGVDTIPSSLFAQLAEGGRLCFLKVSAEQFGEVFLYSKQQGEIVKKLLFEAYHPVLEGFEKKKDFVF